jgi:hypothetical protein
MAYKNKKAMGPYESPMASHPAIRMESMGAPHQNKNKRNRN